MSATETIWLSETFVSIQGEGILVGVPSAFIRTSGCNLRCRWCDTPFTSWEAEGESRAIAGVIAWAAGAEAVRHVVVTGGEPLICKGIELLVAGLVAKRLHVTIETAATVFVPLPGVALWSLSPKLAGSTPGPEAGPWSDRHEATRWRPDVVAQTLRYAENSGADYQLKFVVGHESELEEIANLVREVDARPEKVLLMPEGTTSEALDRGARWLVPAAIARGWRFADRLHIRLFGHTKGT